MCSSFRCPNSFCHLLRPQVLRPASHHRGAISISTYCIVQQQPNHNRSGALAMGNYCTQLWLKPYTRTLHTTCVRMTRPIAMQTSQGLQVRKQLDPHRQRRPGHSHSLNRLRRVISTVSGSRVDHKPEARNSAAFATSTHSTSAVKLQIEDRERRHPLGHHNDQMGLSARSCRFCHAGGLGRRQEPSWRSRLVPDKGR